MQLSCSNSQDIIRRPESQFHHFVCQLNVWSASRSDIAKLENNPGLENDCSFRDIVAGLVWITNSLLAGAVLPGQVVSISLTILSWEWPMSISFAMRTPTEPLSAKKGSSWLHDLDACDINSMTVACLCEVRSIVVNGPLKFTRTSAPEFDQQLLRQPNINVQAGSGAGSGVMVWHFAKNSLKVQHPVCDCDSSNCVIVIAAI